MNTIEIKFIGADKISISRKAMINGIERSLTHLFIEKHFTNENILTCLRRHLIDWDEEMFVPRLEDDYGECYGVIGTSTNLVDINGNELKVGDVVALYNVHDKTKVFTVVCENTIKKTSSEKPRYEILGCFDSKWEKGFSGTDFFIIKEKNFSEMKHNDLCHGVLYKLKND